MARATKGTAKKKPAARAKVTGAKTGARKRRTKPIPENYPRVSVCLRVGHAAEALQYYCDVFGGKVRMRLDMPDGRIGHSEIQIGKGLIMVSDEYPEMNMVGPITVGSVCSTIQIYVKDVDITVAKAVKAGGKLLRPVRDEFYGDRSATLEDPFGHVWMIQTHVEDVPKAEMRKRLLKLFGAG
jgi:PhnB protein